MSEGNRQFEMQIEIAASRGEVWDALTRPEIVSRWFAPEVSVTPGVGGSVQWQWGEMHSWPQTIDVWEPGERLVTRYPAGGTESEDACPLLMDFRLSGEGGSTTLRLVHSGFGPEARFDEEYDGISRGWPVELRSLRLYLENHAGQDRQVVWCTSEFAGTPDEAWKRLTGPEGLGCGADITDLEEGASFDFTTSAGERFHGQAMSLQHHEFTGVAKSHGDAFLRISIEACGGPARVWLGLATYDGDEAARAKRQKDWDALLASLFPVAARSA